MYNKRVEVNEETILKLTSTFRRAYREIYNEIWSATDFGIYNRRMILKQIESVLESLGEKATYHLKKEIPKYYQEGADKAVKQLDNVGAKVFVRKNFNQLHKAAIYALVDDTAKAFGETMTGVSRDARRLLNTATKEELKQRMAKGYISGEARKTIRQNIKGALQEQGLSALVDKGGARWSLDRYADMLLRTKAVEAHNTGLANRMVENGYDLVQVSAHGGTCDVCADWEGKILSLTGETDGYPTVDQAEGAGLFHPNCRHALSALIPSLSRETRAYDVSTRSYK